ncbi:serine hydrolase domain-containing protein [Azospirillum agricola]|uniref:serine hydrolase domain-containing protein n=1 Tax=Azospirillum agricola TaxID=1720247 RepID=UPI000A0EFBB1|nr:serine hydrolase domain-containing protein [Azospirillum agricola]SMH54301.1 CubicO group peptidase, beta-lactamase class C family [Azospirillum lipoferum]
MGEVLDDAAGMAELVESLKGLLNEEADRSNGQGARIATLSILSGDRSWNVSLARSGFVRLKPATDRRALLYSLTKTILAAAVLRLAARGVVDLDGPAERWLPELAGRPASVTVADILSHRAGLPNYGGRKEYRAAIAAGDEPWSGDEFLARCGVEGPPVGVFAYSSIGYLLIRRLLERAGGATLATVLATEVFRPLGLTSATLPERRSELAALLFGPSPAFPGELVVDRYHPGWVAHGVAAMTADDTARFIHGLSTPGYLPDALFRRMRDGLPVKAPLGGRPWVEPSYGMGLMVELDPSAGPYWGYIGCGPGVAVAAYHVPGPRPVSVAVLTDGESVGLPEWMAVEVAHRLR